MVQPCHHSGGIRHVRGGRDRCGPACNIASCSTIVKVACESRGPPDLLVGCRRPSPISGDPPSTHKFVRIVDANHDDAGRSVKNREPCLRPESVLLNNALQAAATTGSLAGVHCLSGLPCRRHIAAIMRPSVPVGAAYGFPLHCPGSIIKNGRDPQQSHASALYHEVPVPLFNERAPVSALDPAPLVARPATRATPLFSVGAELPAFSFLASSPTNVAARRGAFRFFRLARA